MALEFDGERMVKKRENIQPQHPQQPLCACTSYSCNKLFLFMYTCVYVVVGAGLLLLGVWIEFQEKDYEPINKYLFIPAILLMSSGFVIIINSLLGVAGVSRENACLLKTFLVFTILAFLAQVAIGVMAFMHRQEVPGLLSENFMFLVRGYHDKSHYRLAMDNLQIWFRCCGFDSYMDYEENVHFQCGSPFPQKCGVPWTCCRNTKPDSLLAVDCGYQVRWNATVPVDKIYTMGCTDVFLSWLGWNLDLAGIVGLGTAIPQVIGILLTYFFIRQVREMKMWYRVGT